MSVYSGFATRQQQNKYNSLVQTLLITLTKRIIKFYHKQTTNEDKFRLLIKKIFHKMLRLEQNKFYAPKFTQTVSDLIQELNIEIDYNRLDYDCTKLQQSFVIGISNQLVKKNSFQSQFLRSKSVLENKKKQMEFYTSFVQKEKYHNKLFNSFKKRRENFTSQQQQIQAINQKMDNQKLKIKAAARLKLKYLRDVKQLRGTINMPKLQTYIPSPIQLKSTVIDSTICLSPILKRISNKDSRRFKKPKYSNISIQMDNI